MKKLGTALVWIVLIGLFLVLVRAYMDDGPEPAGLNHAGFQAYMERGMIRWARLTPEGTLVGTQDGRRYLIEGELDPSDASELARQGVPIRAGEPRSRGSGSSWLLMPALIIGGVILVLFIFLRRARGQFMGYQSFTKSRARILPETRVSTFDDVGGCLGAKTVLLDVVSYLKDTARWRAAGARPPRGILLEGASGCGKTLLARALAGEAGAKFFYLSASEFVELFVGVGAARVRDTFETASKQAPSIIFIDELDAVGRHRGSGLGGSHDEREQTLNQLLVCLDGLEAYDGIIVLAATNRSDVLDSALLRPGRFDRRIQIDRPTPDERVEILRIHLKGKTLAGDASLEDLAGMTDGFNGAEIESFLNEAAVIALRRTQGEPGAAVRIEARDLQAALTAARNHRGGFDSVDAILIGSTSQVSRPPGRARARITLRDGAAVAGEILWANAEFVKVRQEGSSGEVTIPKLQVQSIVSLDGTTAAPPAEAVADPWAIRPSGTA